MGELVFVNLALFQLWYFANWMLNRYEDLYSLSLVNPLWGFGMVIIPNCTFLLHLRSISGEFGQAMACILVRCSRAKIPKVRLNEHDSYKRICLWSVPKRFDYVFTTLAHPNDPIKSMTWYCRISEDSRHPVPSKVM